VGRADILHNSSYNYTRNNKKCRRQPKGKYYNFYYVTWLGVVFGVSVGRQKAHLALASGTKQKTEDFCLSQKNWVLFCGDFSA